MDSQPDSNKDWVNTQREPDYIVPKGCAPESPVVITDPAPGWDDVSPAINPAWRTATHVFAGDELLRPRPILSILLATVINRAELFAKLHAEVKRQAEGRAVEIIVACDAKEISIGKKRQNLLEQATGEWVCFIDDDDWIAADYVDRILKALGPAPDCVGFLISCTTNGGRPVMAKASKCYKQWGENVDGFAHVRSPYQKTPVRREIALKAGFPDLRYGEDRIYSAAVVKLVKTEVFIDSVCYHYRFRSENFAQKYGISLLGYKKQPHQRPPHKKFDQKGRKV